MFELMLLPFAAALILTGIHVYLGVHVVEREVIFVDLALAQIAALGAVVSVLFGFHLHSTQAFFFSLAFTSAGAALYAFTRLKDSRVPQEAVIGITYVLAAAAAVLVLDRMPGEASHLKEMLVGNILFVGGGELAKIAVLYAAVGLFHYLFREKFILISCDAEAARRSGVNIKLWDFLFYATFGLVVTSSVAVAGVLLVFSFLIMPSVATMLFTDDFRKRLLWGWGLSALTSLTGLYASAALDLPTGAAIVCAFGVLVLGAYLLRALLPRRA